jgi:DNA polymerase I
MRRNDGSIAVTDVQNSDESQVLELDALTDFIRTREYQHPRWIWDDTTSWYPMLLAQDLRVKHCADLRLRHNILRNSPLVDQNVLIGDDIERWDNFAIESIDESALFTLHDSEEPLDTVAEYRRQQAAIDVCPESKKLQLLLMAESTSALIASEMTFAGLPWRADIHEQILTESLGPRPTSGARPAALENLCKAIRIALNTPELNPDSPAELLRALRNNGLAVSDTRSTTLADVKHAAIPLLLEYKKLQRLNAANGWRWLDTWVRNGRYRSTYVPGGVVTGRWAASGGGALSLPTQLRPAVVADEGWVLVVADAAQLEPRVLTGMSADTAMAEAAQGTDIYQHLVDTRVVETREDAKLGMLSAMYGATQGQSGVMVARMAQRYPKAFGLVEAAARAGERGEVVQTFLGRGSPLPNADWVRAFDDSIENEQASARDRRSWGRFTRNFIVQGTGAEWAMCWMATLRNLLWNLDSSGAITDRPHLVFFLHDEIIVHTPQPLAEQVVVAVRNAAHSAGTLLFGEFPVDFPLDVSVVGVYADAK